MQVKLGDLAVKRKTGKTEVDFITFLTSLTESISSRKVIGEIIELQKQYDEVWLDIQLSELFKDDENEK